MDWVEFMQTTLWGSSKESGFYRTVVFKLPVSVSSCKGTLSKN